MDITWPRSISPLMILTSFETGGRAVVIGTGGIGTALAQALAASSAFSDVMLIGRRTDPALELEDEESIARSAKAVAQGDGAIRLVIDATGFLHDEEHKPEKALRELETQHMAKAFALNAIGPALIMKHYLPLLPREGKAVFATLSARVGSIGDNELGGWYSYRASKAALNQLTRTAAIELRRTRPNAICCALHPGTVATDLSVPFSKQGLSIQQPDEAAEKLLMVIDCLQNEDTAGFFDHKGLPITW
jgi:NAD(P)-dependent dehydrogenase (short-subunit alcohol dehydrogenase family)